MQPDVLIVREHTVVWFEQLLDLPCAWAWSLVGPQPSTTSWGAIRVANRRMQGMQGLWGSGPPASELTGWHPCLHIDRHQALTCPHVNRNPKLQVSTHQ